MRIRSAGSLGGFPGKLVDLYKVFQVISASLNPGTFNALSNQSSASLLRAIRRLRISVPISHAENGDTKSSDAAAAARIEPRASSSMLSPLINQRRADVSRSSDLLIALGCPFLSDWLGQIDAWKKCNAPTHRAEWIRYRLNLQAR